MQRRTVVAVLVVTCGMMIGIPLGCVCLSLVGPLTCDGAYGNSRWEGNEAVRFPWHQTGVTPKGVRLDETAGPLALSPAEVDATVDRVAACLGIPAKHCGLRVMVAPPSFAQGPGGTVRAGALQSPATAVVLRNADALPHELVHLLTNDPGHGSDMERCGR